ncbi:MAG: hypothetical protein NTV80_04975 [Verrucomicrobia bacterium]|nr:hypothetical protein [Verrucomicrobiota bacterium]
MKIKPVYYFVLVTAVILVIFLAWRFAAISGSTTSQSNRAQSDQTNTHQSSSFINDNPTATTVESPQMTNERIIAEVKKSTDNLLQQSKRFKTGGLKGMLSAQLDQRENEHKEFFKLLGLSDPLSAKVFQMIKMKETVATANLKAKLASLSRGEQQEAHDSELLRMEEDLKAAVGTENYDKIKYWQYTQSDRKNAQAFRLELESRGLQLTPDQEASLVAALYQARDGRPSFSLNMPFVTKDDKLGYIDNVKQRLTPKLSSSAVDLLGQYLKGVAERPLVPPELQNLLPNGIPANLLTPQKSQTQLR